MVTPSTQTAHRDFSPGAGVSRRSPGLTSIASSCRSHCDTRFAPMDSSYARSSLSPTTRSLPAPTDLASAGVSSLAHTPPALRKKFPLTHPSLCVLLSSAYPFSACSNRQPLVQSSRKGTPTYFLFPHLLIVALLFLATAQDALRLMDIAILRKLRQLPIGAQYLNYRQAD